MMRIWRPWWIINTFGLGLLLYAMGTRFPLALLFTDTVMSGGDAASWYQVAQHLKTELLPQGRLFGWDQGNFFGYPNFQYYFIPPFLLAVALSALIPLTIALKLVTVLGIAATPLATFWSLRRMGYSDPTPLIGAWASSLFLFHERFTMFGGNLLSTLAGEFCYSIAFALMILFMGSLHHGAQRTGRAVASALLLGLVGLSHAFVFLVAVLMPLYLLRSPAGVRAHLGFVARLYAGAFGVMAFWVVPMLAQLEFTSPITMVWRFYSWEQLLDSSFAPILAGGAAALSLGLVRGFRRFQQPFWLYMIGISALLYLMATPLKVADIRFFPPLIFFSLMAVVDAVACLTQLTAQRRHFTEAWALTCAVLIGGLWIYNPDAQAPDWFRWNYAGYEAKPAFQDGTMASLRQALAAKPGAPRVAWEKYRYNADFGSDRIFENLPLLTGRWTTEGIHYASALLSKSISVMHGEYSLYSASPVPLVYSHYDPDILPARFRLFNINQFIAASPKMTAMLDDSPDFQRQAHAGDYTVFRTSAPAPGYVSTPAFRPVLANMPADQWRQRFHAWFRRGEALDVPLVNGPHVSAEQAERYFGKRRTRLDAFGRTQDLPRQPAPSAHIQGVTVDHSVIRFRTDRPGAPHLVRVAYHPNWQAASGAPIFPVSPGLMLIYPQGQEVILRYKRSWAALLGLTITLLTAVGWVGARRLPPCGSS